MFCNKAFIKTLPFAVAAEYLPVRGGPVYIKQKHSFGKSIKTLTFGCAGPVDLFLQGNRIFAGDPKVSRTDKVAEAVFCVIFTTIVADSFHT